MFQIGGQPRLLAILAVFAALADASRPHPRFDLGRTLQQRGRVEGVHVTRLHRYDHSGLSAMLEAEAQWSRKEAPLGRQLQSFVRLSRPQVEALQQHQRLAMVQLRGEASTARRVLVRRRQPSSSENKPVASGLVQMRSQYVGPIGVGTKRSPEGCEPQPGRSLIYENARGEGNSSSLHQSSACHLQDESSILVVHDTGSTNIWVNSDLCTAGPCAAADRRRYNHLESLTYKRPKERIKLEIEFGTGSVSGEQAIDNLHIGPFTVKGQTFGMIREQVGEVFNEVPFEGILGLAFPSMSANGVTPFFDNIIQQRILGNNSFSFYFSLDNPSANAIFWGGVDPNFYEKNIEYFGVSDPFYWSIPLVSFQVGGQELLGEQSNNSSMGGRKPQAIVDTGTTFFTAEGELFAEVMRRLPEKPCSEVTSDSHPPLTYRLRNIQGKLRDYVLDNMQYMTQSNDGTCSPAFMEIPIPEKHGPAMVLGEVFLRHYYSVFDRADGSDGRARVGFALARHGQAVEDRLKHLTSRQRPFYDASKGTKGRRA